MNFITKACKLVSGLFASVPWPFPDNGYFIRNAKFFGIEVTPQFERIMKEEIKVQHELMSHLTRKMLDGTIVKLDKFTIEFKDGTVLTLAQYCDEIRYMFKTEKYKSLCRSRLMYVVERLRSNIQRNKKKDGTFKIPKIRIHDDKSWYFKDAFVALDVDNKTLTFDTIRGPVSVKYNGSIKADELLADLKNRKKKKFGGNYVIKQNCFVAAHRVPFKPLYKPTAVLGFDFNKTASQWIVFNNGEVIPMPDEFYNICMEIKSINKILGEKSKPISQRTMRSKERRKLRKKWKALHKKLNKISKEIAYSIINMAVNSNSLLVLDSVKGGQDLGTFGQDHIMPSLQTACEDLGIPYYKVPCKNTSRRCSECGHIAKDNRKTTEEFKCLSCGHEEVSHFNAAKNISHIGKMLFEACVPFGNYERNKVETIIDRYTNSEKAK